MYLEKIKNDIERLEKGVSLLSYQEDLLTSIFKNLAKIHVSTDISLKSILENVVPEVFFKSLDSFSENIKHYSVKRIFNDLYCVDQYLQEHLNEAYQNIYLNNLINLIPIIPKTFNSTLENQLVNKEIISKLFELKGIGQPHYWFFNNVFDETYKPILNKYREEEILELVQNFTKLGFSNVNSEQMDLSKTANKILSLLQNYSKISLWLINNMEGFDLEKNSSFFSRHPNQKNIALPWIETLSGLFKQEKFDLAEILYANLYQKSEEKFIKLVEKKEKDISGEEKTKPEYELSIHFEGVCGTPHYSLKEVLFLKTFRDYLQIRNNQMVNKDIEQGKDKNFLDFWKDKVDIKNIFQKNLKQKYSFFPYLLNNNPSITLNLWDEYLKNLSIQKVLNKVNFNSYAPDKSELLLKGYEVKKFILQKNYENEIKIDVTDNQYFIESKTDNVASLLHHYMKNKNKDGINYLIENNLLKQNNATITLPFGRFQLEDLMAGSPITWKYFKSQQTEKRVQISHNQLIMAAYHGNQEILKSAFKKPNIDLYKTNADGVSIMHALFLLPQTDYKIKNKKNEFIREALKQTPLQNQHTKSMVYRYKGTLDEKNIYYLKNINFIELFYLSGIGIHNWESIKNFSTKNLPELELFLNNIKTINQDIHLHPLNKIIITGLANVLWNYRSCSMINGSSSNYILRAIKKENLIEEIGIKWDQISSKDKGSIFIETLKHAESPKKLLLLKEEINYFLNRDIEFEEPKILEELYKKILPFTLSDEETLPLCNKIEQTLLQIQNSKKDKNKPKIL